MNKTAFGSLMAFVALSFSLKSGTNDFDKTLWLLKKEFHLNPKNACVFLINNGVCKQGLCGSKLNRFLAEKLPRHNKDTFVFIVVAMDKNLLDTLNLFDKTLVLEPTANTMTKYGLYNLEDKAFKLYNHKITKKSTLHKDEKFNHWF